MAERAAAYRAVVLDFGTGDGAYVLRAARQRPDCLLVGVDANAGGLVEASRRALAKPARGGVANAIFGALSLEAAPGELLGVADELTVLLPWGSLLEAVARADVAALRALCKPGAAVRFILNVPAPADLAPLEAYRAAGLDLTSCAMARDEIRALGTTWAAKLAFSPASWCFIELRGVVI